MGRRVRAVLSRWVGRKKAGAPPFSPDVLAEQLERLLRDAGRGAADAGAQDMYARILEYHDRRAIEQAVVDAWVVLLGENLERTPAKVGDVVTIADEDLLAAAFTRLMANSGAAGCAAPPLYGRGGLRG